LMMQFLFLRAPTSFFCSLRLFPKWTTCT
jgi:hypothetical protein